jgi:hypothetical protein
MATEQERIEELKQAVLKKLGMTEVPARIQVAWDNMLDLVALHGDSALDDLVGAIRFEIEHPYGMKVDAP